MTSTPRDNSTRGLGTGTGPVRRPPLPEPADPVVALFADYHRCVMRYDRAGAIAMQKAMRAAGYSICVLSWAWGGGRRRP